MFEKYSQHTQKYNTVDEITAAFTQFKELLTKDKTLRKIKNFGKEYHYTIKDILELKFGRDLIDILYSYSVVVLDYRYLAADTTLVHGWKVIKYNDVCLKIFPQGIPVTEKDFNKWVSYVGYLADWYVKYEHHAEVRRKEILNKLSKLSVKELELIDTARLK